MRVVYMFVYAKVGLAHMGRALGGPRMFVLRVCDPAWQESEMRNFGQLRSWVVCVYTQVD